jgi:DNA-binding transcriptional regulator YhcF (GntR family)
MDSNDILQYIHLDDRASTPKYQQLANSIVEAVRIGQVKKEQTLPSINELSFHFEMSRDTAERGYKYLKDIGILGSVPGKGFFVKNVDVSQQLRVFILFNKLSPHKKIIYDSIAAALSNHAAIDLYIYNNDFAFFKKLLQSKKDGYTHYVIISHFLDGGENVHDVINEIDKEKLILLDKLVPGVTGNFSAVYENFEKDIYHALEQALPQLSKYATLKMVFPDHTYYPREIVHGFQRFCDQYAFNHKTVNRLEKETIGKGEVFISLMESDLVELIEMILTSKLKVGRDVGVISYNETPVKKIILDGITTVSTDFQMMGERVANIILQKSQQRIEVPFRLTIRPSL